MLVPFEHTVDEPEFRRLLLDHFPELANEIEGDSGLVHLEMSALERLANRSIKGGDISTLKRMYEFVGDMASHLSEVHPDVVMLVTFLFKKV